ncbi:PLxRFG domain-containing protein [Vibrio litoralis]|uniref:PLxRFG domain-containing protein n=1 Tax=Vibrio litoralis TaxID=335972 RepID=UPI000403F998
MYQSPFRKFKPASQPNDQSENEQGFIGDFIDNVQRGFYQGIAGDAETVNQLTGYGSGARDLLLEQADNQIKQMSLEGQEALSKQIFEDDENGNLRLGEGATNLRTWTNYIGQGVGTVAAFLSTGVAGAGVKGAAKIGVKAVGKKFGKDAAEETAEALLKKEAAQKTAELGFKGKAADVVTNAAISVAMGNGMSANQERDRYQNMSWSELQNSPKFSELYYSMRNDPQYRNVSDEQIGIEARKQLAEDAAKSAFYNPKLVAANSISGLTGALGGSNFGLFGRVIGPASTAKSGLAKGASVEGGQEFLQGGTEQIVSNENYKRLIDPNFDVMDGVVSSGLNEAAVGAALGGPFGAVEGYSRARKIKATPETSNDAGDPENQIWNGETMQWETPQERMQSQADQTQPVPTPQQRAVEQPLSGNASVDSELHALDDVSISSIESPPPVTTDTIAQDNTEQSPEWVNEAVGQSVTTESLLQGAAQRQQSNREYLNDETIIGEAGLETPEVNATQQIEPSPLEQRRQQSRAALQQSGVLPQINAEQETIDLARAYDPNRMADIESEINRDDLSEQEIQALESEVVQLADIARELDISPLQTSIMRRQNENMRNMANREKPHQRVERKQSEYDLANAKPTHSPARIKQQIRQQIITRMTPQDASNNSLVDRMVDLEYERQFPTTQNEVETIHKSAVPEFEPIRTNGRNVIEQKAIDSRNAKLSREAEIERQLRARKESASPQISEQEQSLREQASAQRAELEQSQAQINPNWVGKVDGQTTTRTFARDKENQQRQAREEKLQGIRNRIESPASNFGDRPNSMKLREQGKIPMRDLASRVQPKTKGMNKSLKKRINEAKGFDTDRVLREFQQHEKRLQAYEKEAVAAAEREANNPENIARRKTAEALFADHMESEQAKEFAENSITQAVKQINTELDKAGNKPSTVLEWDGENLSAAEVKQRLNNSARSLADKFIGKTAAMNERLRQKREANKASKPQDNKNQNHGEAGKPEDKSPEQEKEPKTNKKPEPKSNTGAEDQESENQEVTMESGNEADNAEAIKPNIESHGVSVTYNPVSKQDQDEYNRSTHLGEGRNFNAELNQEAESVINELNDDSALDTPERQQKASELISQYINDYADFYRWESQYASKNPSWLVTGRAGHSQAQADRANAANEKHMNEFTKRVDALDKQRKNIKPQVEAVRNQEQQAEYDQQMRDQKQSNLEAKVTNYTGDVYNFVQDGRNELAKDARRWANPKAEKALDELSEMAPDRVSPLLLALDTRMQNAGGLVAVVGARSNLGKKIKPLLDSAKAEQEKQTEETTNKIEDFGETLHGARKHEWGKFGEALRADSSVSDVESEPLSKAFPKPNYQALHNNGVPIDKIAAIALIRKSIPAKPRAKWRSTKNWADNVLKQRTMAKALIDDAVNVEDILAGELGGRSLARIYIDAAKQLGVDKIDTLMEFEITGGSYSMANGIKYSPSKSLYQIRSKRFHSDFFETHEETTNKLVELVNERSDTNSASKPKRKRANLNVYRNRYTGEVYIGLGVGSRVVKIKDGFADAKEARAHLSDNQAELEQQVIDKRKDLSKEQRNDENRDREGVIYREGDVTPEQFSDAFGFRGVQFGNWVEGKRRQKDLNDAYDSLVDLANVIGVPLKALSLNGQLGLAFGARGSGGKNAAAAHYEPGNTVINLTKMNGKGSLAHEWFHALDDYFGESGYVSNQRGSQAGDMRPELKAAFDDVVNTIENRTSIKERSLELDKYRTEPYWSTTVEMIARSFESWVIDKNRESGITNDYLANVVPESAMEANEYAYPTQQELKEGLGASFDHLFDIMDSRSEEGNVALFSRGAVSVATASESKIRSILPRGVDTQRGFVTRAVNRVLNQNGLARVAVPIQVVSTEADLPPHIQQQIDEQGAKGEIKGVYDKGANRIYVVADRHNTESSVEEVIFHELVGHHGLYNMLGEKLKPELNTIALRLGGVKGVADLAKGLGVDLSAYEKTANAQLKSGKWTPELAHTVMVDELVSHLSQQKRFSTIMDRVVAKVKALLRSMGFEKLAKYGKAEIIDLVTKAKGSLNNPPPKGSGSDSDTAMFSRSSDNELTPEQRAKDAKARTQNINRNEANSLREEVDAKATDNYGKLHMINQRRGNDTLNTDPEPGPQQNPTMSADQALQQKQSKLVTRIKRALTSNSAMDALGKNKYAMLTLRQIAEVSEKVNPRMGEMITGYLDRVNEMMVTQNTLAEEAAEIAEDMSKWARKNKKGADELFSFMHAATLADVDPSKPFESMKETLEERIKVLNARAQGLGGEAGMIKEIMDEITESKKLIKGEKNRQLAHTMMRPKWHKMTPEQKRRYKEMRDHYITQRERMQESLISNIERSIEDKKMRKAAIENIRYENERASKGLYFPLSRYGDYWVNFADENGERQFIMYETKAEMESAVESLSKAGFNVNFGEKLQSDTDMNGPSLGFVADVIDSIKGAKMNDGTKQQLTDSIYQMYLKTMPSRSLRQNFIHRKGVAGFSNDAIQALADQGFRQSRQQARLDHMDILDNEMEALHEHIKATPNNVEADRIYKEMVKRHDWVRNPKRAAWAQKLTSLGFTWLLGATPAAALVNLTQNVQVALPVLGSKYGMLNASKEMAKATKEFMQASGKHWRGGRNGIVGNTLTGREKEAFRQAIKQGVIDTTQASDLTGLAENPTAKYSGKWNKVMNAVGFAFQKAEVFNREVTFLAAYRLAYEKNGDHEQAIKDAMKATWDSHFDYGSLNRARFMQGDIAAVALQFKQYSQNMTYYLWSNIIKATKGESKEVKDQAKKQLLGTLASTFMIGGASALPISIVLEAVNAAQDAFGDDDEPFDAETELKSMLTGAFGKDAAQALWFGASPSISGRISLNDLWLRQVETGTPADERYMEYMKQAMGPVVGGIAYSFAQGLDYMSDGHYGRGAEKMLPKAGRDLLKTVRYMNEEGVMTKNGAPITDELSAASLVKQAIGFTPGEAVIQYDENNSLYNYKNQLSSRRSSLMNSYATAYRLGDEEARKEIMKKIKRWNSSKYGKLSPITPKALNQSIRMRLRQKEQAVNGVSINNKFRQLATEYDYF